MVELAKDWRTDKILRHLEALLLVADATNTFIVSGNGDVIEPDQNFAAMDRAVLRAFRGDSSDPPHETDGAADRGRIHEDRGQDLHLHQ